MYCSFVENIVAKNEKDVFVKKCNFIVQLKIYEVRFRENR